MLVFLFTDIEDSCWLWEEHTEVMGAVIERHDAILEEVSANRKLIHEDHCLRAGSPDPREQLDQQPQAQVQRPPQG